MTVALIVLAGVFAALFLLRVAGARRFILVRKWPSVLLGVAAAFALGRGAVGPAVGLAVIAAALWVIDLSQVRNKGSQTAAAPDPRDIEARATLGVGENATAAEIRAAYRERIARAHPDRGGSHAEAARLTAARDRLLKR